MYLAGLSRISDRTTIRPERASGLARKSDGGRAEAALTSPITNNGQDVAVRLGDITVFGDVKPGVATDYIETATT